MLQRVVRLSGIFLLLLCAGSAQASQLAFSVQPADTVPGANISPGIQVAVQDADGNTVTTDTSSITLSIGGNPGGGTLTGTLTVSAVNGVASFNDLKIDKTGTAYTLNAASSGGPTGGSAAFNVLGVMSVSIGSLDNSSPPVFTINYSAASNTDAQIYYFIWGIDGANQGGPFLDWTTEYPASYSMSGLHTGNYQFYLYATTDPSLGWQAVTSTGWVHVNGLGATSVTITSVDNSSPPTFTLNYSATANIVAPIYYLIWGINGANEGSVVLDWTDEYPSSYSIAGLPTSSYIFYLYATTDPILGWQTVTSTDWVHVNGLGATSVTIASVDNSNPPTFTINYSAAENTGATLYYSIWAVNGASQSSSILDWTTERPSSFSIAGLPTGSYQFYVYATTDPTLGWQAVASTDWIHVNGLGVTSVSIDSLDNSNSPVFTLNYSAVENTGAQIYYSIWAINAANQGGYVLTWTTEYPASYSMGTLQTGSYQFYLYATADPSLGWQAVTSTDWVHVNGLGVTSVTATPSNPAPGVAQVDWVLQQNETARVYCCVVLYSYASGTYTTVQNWAAGADTGSFQIGGLASGSYEFYVMAGTLSGETQASVFSQPFNVSDNAETAPTVQTAAAANPASVDGNSTTLSVLGMDQYGEETLTYQWACTSGPAAVAFTGVNNTNSAKDMGAAFTAAGTYSFSVTLTGESGLTTVSGPVQVVVNQTLTAAIQVTPSGAAIVPNTVQAFVATGYDQFGNSMALTDAFWSLDDPNAGSIDQTGLFTAGNTPVPVFTVSASAGAATGSAQASVIELPPVINTAGADANPVFGTSVGLSVSAASDGGESNLIYVWTVLSPSPASTFSANASNAAKQTTVTFDSPGNYAIMVTAIDAAGQSVSSTVSFSVQQSVSSIFVTQQNPLLNVGDSQQFSAEAMDQFGQPMDATLSWDAFGAGSISSTGLFSAGVAPGAATVSATAVDANGISQTFSFTATVVSLSVDSLALASYVASGDAPDFIGGVTTYFTNNGYITLQASVSTSLDPIYDVTVTFNAVSDSGTGSTSATVSGAGSGTLQQDLQLNGDGRYLIGATVSTTKDGQTAQVNGTQQLAVVYVATAPVLHLPTPAPVETTGPDGAVVLFDVSATSTFSPQPVIYLSRQSGTYFPLRNTTVTAMATDRCGNFSQGTFVVTVQDTVPPVILNGQVSGQFGLFDVYVLANKDRNGNDLPTAVAYQVYALDVGTPNPILTIDPPSGSSFAPGSTTVTVTATDVWPNTTVSRFTVTVGDDETQMTQAPGPISPPLPPPGLNVGNLTPADGAFLNYLRPVLSATITANPGDGLHGFASEVYTLDGVSVLTSENGFYYVPPADLQAGLHHVQVTVSDSEDPPVTVTANWSFTVDVTPPVISALVPAGSTIIGSATPLCSATFSDDVSGVDVNSVKIVLGGQDVTAQANVSAGGFSFTAAGLSEGFHNLSVSLKDKCGNAATASSTFQIQLPNNIAGDGSGVNAPVLSGFQIANGLSGDMSGMLNGEAVFFTNHAEVLVQVQAATTMGKIANVTFNAAGAGPVPVPVTGGRGLASGIYSASMVLPAEGRYELSATATASDGVNSASASTITNLILIVCRTAPSLNYCVPLRHSMTEDRDIVYLNGNKNYQYDSYNRVVPGSENTNQMLRSSREVNCYGPDEFSVRATVNSAVGLSTQQTQQGRIVPPVLGPGHVSFAPYMPPPALSPNGQAPPPPPPSGPVLLAAHPSPSSSTQGTQTVWFDQPTGTFQESIRLNEFNWYNWNWTAPDPFAILEIRGPSVFHINLADRCGNRADQDEFKIWIDRTPPSACPYDQTHSPYQIGKIYAYADIYHNTQQSGTAYPVFPSGNSVFASADTAEIWQYGMSANNWLFKKHRTPTGPPGSPALPALNLSEWEVQIPPDISYRWDHPSDLKLLMRDQAGNFTTTDGVGTPAAVAVFQEWFDTASWPAGTVPSVTPGVLGTAAFRGTARVFSPSVINIPPSYASATSGPDYTQPYQFSHLADGEPYNNYIRDDWVPLIGIAQAIYCSLSPHTDPDLEGDWLWPEVFYLDGIRNDLVDPRNTPFPSVVTGAIPLQKAPASGAQLGSGNNIEYFDAVNGSAFSFHDTDPGILRTGGKAGQGNYTSNAIKLTPDVVATGNVVKLKIAAGFMRPVYDYGIALSLNSDFLSSSMAPFPGNALIPSNSYVQFMAPGGINLTGDPNETDAVVRANKITIQKDSNGVLLQRLMPDQREPSLSQTLEMTVEIGANVPAGLYNVDVKMGQVVADPNEVISHASPDNAGYHRMAGEMNVVNLPQMSDLYQLEVKTATWQTGLPDSITSKWFIELDSNQQGLVWLDPSDTVGFTPMPEIDGANPGKKRYPFKNQVLVVGKASQTETYTTITLLTGSDANAPKIDVPVLTMPLSMSQIVNPPTYGTLEAPNQPYGLLGNTGQLTAGSDLNDLQNRNIRFISFNWDPIPQLINNKNIIAVNCTGEEVPGNAAAVKIEGWRPGFTTIKATIPLHPEIELGRWEVICHIPNIHAPNLGQIKAAVSYIKLGDQSTAPSEETITDPDKYPWDPADPSDANARVPNNQNVRLPVSKVLRKLEAQRTWSQYILTQFSNVENQSPLDDDFLFLFGDGTTSFSKQQASNLFDAAGGITPNMGPKLNLISRLRQYDGWANTSVQVNNLNDDIYLPLKVVAREQLDFALLTILNQGVSIKYDPADFPAFVSLPLSVPSTADFQPGHNMLRANWSTPGFLTLQSTISANVESLFTASGVNQWNLSHPYTREVLKFMIAQRQDLARALQPGVGGFNSNIVATLYNPAGFNATAPIHIFNDLSWISDPVSQMNYGGPEKVYIQWSGKSIFDNRHGEVRVWTVSPAGVITQNDSNTFEELNPNLDWISNLYAPDSAFDANMPAEKSFSYAITEAWYLTGMIRDLETLSALQQLQQVIGTIGVQSVWFGDTFFSIGNIYKGALDRDLITDTELNLTTSERILDIEMATIDIGLTAVPLGKGVERFVSGGARMLKNVGSGVATRYLVYATAEGLALAGDLGKIAGDTAVDLSQFALVKVTQEILTPVGVDAVRAVELASDAVGDVLGKEVAERTATRVETVAIGQKIAEQNAHQLLEVAGSISRATPTREMAAWSRAIKTALKTADPEFWTNEKLREFVRNACFGAGTPVLMCDDSFKPIERITIGDRVISRNQDGQKGLVTSIVTRTFKHTSDHIRVLRLRKILPSARARTFHAVGKAKYEEAGSSDGDSDGNGDGVSPDNCDFEIIRTTDDHPFWSLKLGWVSACDLAPGSLLALGDDGIAVVASNEHIPAPLGIYVYNFEVADTHTYFVGHSACWVHNTCQRLVEFQNYLTRAGVNNVFRPGTVVPATDIARLYYQEVLKKTYLGITINLQGYSASSFRASLIRMYDAIHVAVPGVRGAGYHAHHIFPQELFEDFARRGVFVNDPIYGTFVKAGTHLNIIHPVGSVSQILNYNEWWIDWLQRNPAATSIEIKAQGRIIAQQLGLVTLF